MPDGFELFTPQARRVLTLAQEEAHRFKHNYIGTEHLLLGLVRQGDGAAARVLANMGVRDQTVIGKSNVKNRFSVAIHLLLLAAAGLLLLTACSAPGATSSERDKAIIAAKQVYQQAKSKGINFSNGPCIAEQLPKYPDWSVDIAHNPRESVDNQPANQCQDYLSGKTHHLVELNANGLLIRAQ